MEIIALRFCTFLLSYICFQLFKRWLACLLATNDLNVHLKILLTLVSCCSFLREGFILSLIREKNFFNGH